MTKVMIALGIIVLSLGFRAASAQTDVDRIPLRILDTQRASECGPDAPASEESVGHAILRFNPNTSPTAEESLVFLGGLPDTQYSYYVVRATDVDPCDYFIKSNVPLVTNSNGVFTATGTLGTVVRSGDNIAIVLITPPPSDFEPGNGEYTQIIQSAFVTVP